VSAPLPARLGRYEIRSEIGRGMMGVVYEAHDPALGRVVALKTIQVAFAVSESERAIFEQRFITEARLAAALTHPNIVVVHDVGRDEATGTPYIALEYLKGKPLSDLVPPPLEWREALRITARLADALQLAHSHGIVHRDIKPGNVMLLPNGQPKIMDFGIARAPSSQLTAAGEFFGTPSYMSPEQAAGDDLDGRSDLFSLGAVLYLLVSGERAFDAKSVPGILAKVERENPPPPSTFAAGVPAAVDAMVARLIAKRPKDRYADGKQLAEDIEDILAGRSPRHFSGAPTLPKPDPGTAGTARLGAPGRARAPLQAETLLGWAALAVALVVAGGLLLQGHWAPATRSPSRAAGSPAPDATPAPTPTPAPTTTTTLPPVQPASLTLSVEHNVGDGSLRLLIDGRILAERHLEGEETKKALFFKGHKGSLVATVDVPPGDHIVRIEVREKGEALRAAQIRGQLRPGQARLLEVKVGGDVSLKWK
jgi:eukaryotic-like serine/threonine-protein kinase